MKKSKSMFLKCFLIGILILTNTQCLFAQKPDPLDALEPALTKENVTQEEFTPPPESHIRQGMDEWLVLSGVSPGRLEEPWWVEPCP